MDMYKNVSQIKSLKEVVYTNIKEAIIKGELKPEDSLVEMDIARQMDISRAPIREALNKLEQDGFIVNTPRKGCKVTPISEKDISELYEARLLLESFALRKITDLITEEDLQIVEGMLLEVLKSPNNYEHYINADRSLHSLFHRYLPNDYVGNLLRHVDDHSMRIRYSESFDGLNQQEVLLITNEHLEILDALKNRDADRAVRALEIHIMQGEKRTLKTVCHK